MTLTRWQPLSNVWDEMNRLQNEMNRRISRFSPVDRLVCGTFPALGIWQDEDALYVEAELPGTELDDLEIHVTGRDALEIKGQRKPPSVENATWHRQERGFGKFTRIVKLPTEVNAENVTANLSNGVLTVTLPKLEETKPHKIEVKKEG